MLGRLAPLEWLTKKSGPVSGLFPFVRRTLTSTSPSTVKIFSRRSKVSAAGEKITAFLEKRRDTVTSAHIAWASTDEIQKGVRLWSGGAGPVLFATGKDAAALGRSHQVKLWSIPDR